MEQRQEHSTGTLEKLINEYNQNGLLSLLNKALCKMGRCIFWTTNSIWYERNLNDPIHHFVPGLAIETEFLVEDKSRLILWLKKNWDTFPWIYHEKETVSAINNRHLYVIVSNRSQIIGYSKIGLGSTYIRDFEKSFKLSDDIAFLYDIFVLPQFRGHKVALFVLNEVSQHLKNRKYQKVVCNIEKWNIPSIKTFKNARYKSINTIRFVRILFLSFFLKGGYIPLIRLDNFLKWI